MLALAKRPRPGDPEMLLTKGDRPPGGFYLARFVAVE
jgi:hypothetical protein